MVVQSDFSETALGAQPLNQRRLICHIQLVSHLSRFSALSFSLSLFHLLPIPLVSVFTLASVRGSQINDDYQDEYALTRAGCTSCAYLSMRNSIT